MKIYFTKPSATSMLLDTTIWKEAIEFKYSWHVVGYPLYRPFFSKQQGSRHPKLQCEMILKVFIIVNFYFFCLKMAPCLFRLFT